MVWKGVIVEESLENKELLNLVKIVETKQTTLEEQAERGIMHFHSVEVEDSEKDQYIEKARSALKQKWYTHICKDGRMIVVFKGKAFEFTENEKEKIEEAREYGLSLGIVKEQMPFEELINDPYHLKRSHF